MVSIYYGNEFGNTPTDLTYYLKDMGSLDSKIEDEIILGGGSIQLQNCEMTLLYSDTAKTIIDNATESNRHIIKIVATLPSGATKTVFEGGIDLRTLEIDDYEKTANFSLYDKLSYAKVVGIIPTHTGITGDNQMRETKSDVFTACNNTADKIVIAKDNDHYEIFPRDSSDDPLDINENAFYSGDVINVPDANGDNDFFLVTKFERIFSDGLDKYIGKVYGVGNLNTSFSFVGSDPRIVYYKKNVLGNDVWNVTNGVATEINGLALIKGYLAKLDANATVDTNPLVGTSGYAIGVEDWKRLTFDEVENVSDVIKEFAEMHNLYIFVNRDGNFVLRPRYDGDFGSTLTIAESDYKLTEQKDYGLDIAYKVTVTVSGNDVDANGDEVTATYTATNQNFNRGEHIEKEVKYNGKTTDTAVLLADATNRANKILAFFGKRHSSKTIKVILKEDDYFNFNLLDEFGNYFVNSLEYDFLNFVCEIGFINRLTKVDSIGFDGATQYAETDTFTFADTDAWAYEELIKWHGSSKSYIFHAGNRTRTGDGLLLKYGNAFAVRNTSKNYSLFSGSPSGNIIGKWTHLVWEADGEGNLSLYINGILLATISAVTSFSFNCFGQGYPTGAYMFEGQHKASRLYNCKLSNLDGINHIPEVYNRISENDFSIPTALLSHNVLSMLAKDVDGTTITDSSGNGHTTTLATTPQLFYSDDWE